MWMRVLAAAGFPPIGAAFPGSWKETIGEANEGGFYESLFRQGIYHRTNPHPTTGRYVHPDMARGHAVKIFPFGLRRTHRAFIDRVVVTMRPWAEYQRSRDALLALEAERKAPEVPAPAYVPAAWEWLFDNLLLLTDLAVRRLPHRVMTYDAALRDPARVEAVIRWLGGDVAAASEVVPARRTQGNEVREQADTGGLPEETLALMDQLYATFDAGHPPSPEVWRGLNAARAALEPRFREAMSRQLEDQERWHRAILASRASGEGS